MRLKRLSGTLPAQLQRQRKAAYIAERRVRGTRESIRGGNQILQDAPLMRFYSSRHRLT